MFKCFKLDVTEFDIEKIDESDIQIFKQQGNKIKKGLRERFDSLLKEIISDDNIIDGEELIKNWFPVDRYDVFISYSHEDEDVALFFAGYLSEIYNLSVFIDELFWGSADQLLKNWMMLFVKKRMGIIVMKREIFRHLMFM